MSKAVVTVKITGAQELQDALKGLKNAARKRVLERGLRAGAERVLQAARRRAPSEAIRRGLQVVNVKTDRTGELTLEAGLPGGRHDWFYGFWVELGTGPRFRKSRSTGFDSLGRRRKVLLRDRADGFTGSMPATPFLRPAFDEQQAEAQQAFFDVVKLAIEEVPKRGRIATDG